MRPPNHTDSGEIETLIRVIRQRITMGQTQKEIAKAFPNIPTHEVYHAYVAAKILEGVK